MMNIDEVLKRGFAGESTIIPTIECTLPSEQDASIIRRFGLPTEFGGWFRAVPTINVVELPTVVTYDTGLSTRELKSGALISISRMFQTLIDLENGCIAFQNGASSGFLNSSIVSMLLCMAHFLESARVEYSDVETRWNICKELDGQAFADPEGLWDELFREAADGMY